MSVMKYSDEPIQLFVTSAAMLCMLRSDFGYPEVPRSSYIVDIIDLPLTISVEAGENAYFVESWARLDDGYDGHCRTDPLVIEYGHTVNICADDDDSNRLKRIAAVTARQLERWASGSRSLEHTPLPGEKTGLFLDSDGNELLVSVLDGDERPELLCYSSGDMSRGDIVEVMGRPYEFY